MTEIEGGHVQVFFDASSFNRALSAVSLRLTSNMSLAANIVRDAVVEAASLTTTQPRERDKSRRLARENCRRCGLYERGHREFSSFFNTASSRSPCSPIPTRSRANGARHHCRSADATRVVRGNLNAEMYDAAMAAYPTIVSTRSLPGLKAPLLPASKYGNSQAQAENQLSIITNAVHEMVSQEQRQALWQAQLAPLQPPDSTQSTLFPENR